MTFPHSFLIEKTMTPRTCYRTVIPSFTLETIIAFLFSQYALAVRVIKNNYVRTNHECTFSSVPNIFTNNKKPEIRFDPSKSQAEFPVTNLSKGMMANGMIRFNNYQDLAGQKLVFNSPDHEPVMTFIEKYEPEVK